MRKILGLILILAGIALGIYVGFWLYFIGGIVSIVDQVRSPGDNYGLEIACGAGKVILSGFAGWASSLILVFPGFMLMEDGLMKGNE